MDSNSKAELCVFEWAGECSLNGCPAINCETCSYFVPINEEGETEE